MGPTRYNSWRRAKKACKRCKKRGRARCHLMKSSRAAQADGLRRKVVAAAGAYVKKPTKRRCQSLKRALRKVGS